MKIISVSDIHGDIKMVELLYAKLKNINYDLMLIAGDIGDFSKAKEIANILSELKTKIYYIQGNHDTYSYETILNDNAVHIHLNHQTFDGWCFLGYSGSEANFYREHPSLSGSFEYYNNNLKDEFPTYYQYRTFVIFKEIIDYIDLHDIDIDDLIFLSHDRLYKLPFTPLLYIFGHQHFPNYSYKKGIHLLNTSMISKNDRIDIAESGMSGNFCLITLNRDFDISVKFNKIKNWF